MPDVPAIQYDAFISYARKEAGMGAAPLDSALKGESFKVWRDKRNIDPSADFTAEIEKGMEAAQRVILCLTPDCLRDNSFVRREIAYAEILNKPVLVARFAEVRPPISVVNCTWVDFFTDWDDGLARLVAWLRGAEPPESTRSTHTDPFRPYVEALYKQIVADLKFSVFSDDVIPLRSQSAPDAVPTPTLTTRFVTYSVAEPKPQREVACDFNSFPAAWHTYDGRVLLLGEPGAGKTTTLLAFARNAAAARLNNPAQPLPILARIAGWDSLKQTPLTEWLSTEIESLVGTPFMASAAPIANLIAQGNTLLLLDGLDELGAERLLDPNNPQEGTYDPRARFLPLIPVTGRVLLTSRELEYNQIGLQAGLKGAVVLKPLDDTQMQAYLTGMDDLWAVLASDNALREAIRTPLLLALFRVAFAELPEEARQLRDLSGGDLNDRIWSLFIERRWKHEQSRSSEPLPFSVEELTKALGIAAVQMLAEFGPIDHTRFVQQDMIEANLKASFHFTDWTRESDDEAKFYTRLIVLAQQLQLIHFAGIAYIDSIRRTYDIWGQCKTYSFIHLRLRDYFVFRGGSELCKSSNSVIRSMTLGALGNLRDVHTTALLLKHLHDPDPVTRGRAMIALEKLESKCPFEELAKMVQDDSAENRWLLAAIMTTSGSPLAYEIVRTLLDDSVDFVRHKAIRGLIILNDKRALTPFINALSDSDQVIRLKALHGLCELGDLRAAEPLIKELNNPNNTVDFLSSIIMALGTLNNSRAVIPISTLLTDQRPTEYGTKQVRDVAALALRKIGTDEALQILRSHGLPETEEYIYKDWIYKPSATAMTTDSELALGNGRPDLPEDY